MEHSKPLDCTMAGRNAKTVAELLHRSKAMRPPKMPERRRDTTTKKNGCWDQLVNGCHNL